MKVISLLQPWATLVVTGKKKIETRSWNTKYRGELLIHASAGKNKEGKELAKYNRYFYEALKTEYDLFGLYNLPFGSIIGKVNLMDTVMIQTLFHMTVVAPEGLSIEEREFGNYTDGRHAWLLSDPIQFKKPIPAKGSLGIWNYDGEIPVLVPN